MAGLKEFFEKLESDTDLQEKVKAAGDENALLKVITDAGYEVTLDELRSQTVSSEGKLEDSDLDNIAAGVFSYNGKTINTYTCRHCKKEYRAFSDKYNGICEKCYITRKSWL